MKTTKKQKKEELPQEVSFILRGLSTADVKKLKEFIKELRENGVEIA